MPRPRLESQSWQICRRTFGSAVPQRIPCLESRKMMFYILCVSCFVCLDPDTSSLCHHCVITMRSDRELLWARPAQDPLWAFQCSALLVDDKLKDSEKEWKGLVFMAWKSTWREKFGCSLQVAWWDLEQYHTFWQRPQHEISAKGHGVLILFSSKLGTHTTFGHSFLCTNRAKML